MKCNKRVLRLFLCMAIFGVYMYIPSTIVAQSSERIEVFGGFSNIKVDPGVEGVESFGTNGFHVEATRFLSRKLGIAAEFSGLYGSTTPDIEGVDELSVAPIRIPHRPAVQEFRVLENKLKHESPSLVFQP